MADHIRQQLVAAVKAAVTNLTTTGSRVFGFRVNPLQGAAELPGLCVYAQADSAEPTSLSAPILYDRSIEVHVVGYVGSNNDPDGTLDLISKEVETVLGAALTVAGVSVRLLYRGCDKHFEAGEKQAGSIDMRFDAPHLFNRATTPDVLT